MWLSYERLSLDACLNTAASTVEALPASPMTGDEARVTDATDPEMGAIVVGGGDANAKVWWNGAAWTVTGI